MKYKKEAEFSYKLFSNILWKNVYVRKWKKNISRQSAHCKQKENVIHLLFWMLKCWKHMDVVSIFSHSKYKNTMEAYCGWLLSCKKRKKKLNIGYAIMLKNILVLCIISTLCKWKRWSTASFMKSLKNNVICLIIVL